MPMNDYMAHICMIIICITAHQCVITDILTAISVNVWPYQCLSGNQSMYSIQRFYYSNYSFSFVVVK